jgi:5-methylcytosine-specific restriction endonuclease McrA
MTARGKTYRAAQEAVRARSGGLCEAPRGWQERWRCTTFMTVTHHRRRRAGLADDTPDNLIALCRNCHDAVHANPLMAYGFELLERHGGAAPRDGAA